MRLALLLALAALFACPCAAAPARQPWIGSWGAAPTPVNLVATARNRVSASLSNQTLRQVVRVSAGGSKVRIRFSNEYGAAPLRIGSAHLALAGEGGAILAGSDHALTFGGSPTAVIPPGAPLISDPVEMKLAPLSSLAVSLYLPSETGPCTCHPVGVQTGYASGPGDFTAAVALPVKDSFLYRAFLSGVEVVPERSGATIVVLGDSISDGTASTPDRNQRWPDRLAERLHARDGARRAWGVVNQGISGNRVLAPGAGESALARFDRDVLATPGLGYVVVMLGVNDLGLGLGPNAPPVRLTPAEVIAGYRQMIGRAHAKGLKIYGATLTPYEGAAYWSAEGEAARQAINAWIRTSGAYDAVIDMDAAWRDPDRPSRIRPGLGAPDNLHGSGLGYRTLGDAVNLSLFR